MIFKLSALQNKWKILRNALQLNLKRRLMDSIVLAVSISMSLWICCIFFQQTFYFIVIIRCHLSLVLSLTTVWLDDCSSIVIHFHTTSNPANSFTQNVKYFDRHHSTSRWQLQRLFHHIQYLLLQLHCPSKFCKWHRNFIKTLIKLTWSPNPPIIICAVVVCHTNRAIIKFQQKLFTVTAVQVRHTAQIYKWKRTRFHFRTRFFLFD